MGNQVKFMSKEIINDTEAEELRIKQRVDTEMKAIELYQEWLTEEEAIKYTSYISLIAGEDKEVKLNQLGEKERAEYLRLEEKIRRAREDENSSKLNKDSGEA